MIWVLFAELIFHLIGFIFVTIIDCADKSRKLKNYIQLRGKDKSKLKTEEGKPNAKKGALFASKKSIMKKSKLEGFSKDNKKLKVVYKKAGSNVEEPIDPVFPPQQETPHEKDEEAGLEVINQDEELSDLDIKLNSIPDLDDVKSDENLDSFEPNKI